MPIEQAFYEQGVEFGLISYCFNYTGYSGPNLQCPSVSRGWVDGRPEGWWRKNRFNSLLSAAFASPVVHSSAVFPDPLSASLHEAVQTLFAACRYSGFRAVQVIWGAGDFKLINVPNRHTTSCSVCAASLVRYNEIKEYMHNNICPKGVFSVSWLKSPTGREAGQKAIYTNVTGGYRTWIRNLRVTN